jgi:predicted transcriptional regulator of viral defense system
MVGMTSAGGRAIETFQRHGGTLRTSQAEALGVSRSTLYRLVATGDIERLDRGLYRLADLPPPSDPDLFIVTQRVPGSVVCLVSALAFHDLTTQIPHEVQIAVSRTSRYPAISHPPTRVFRFQEDVFRAGVETQQVDGHTIRVYSREKTIADCFKYRNKIGLDIALEALRLYWQRGRPDINSLMAYARTCRVNRIIRPYVEVLE